MLGWSVAILFLLLLCSIWKSLKGGTSEVATERFYHNFYRNQLSTEERRRLLAGEELQRVMHMRNGSKELCNLRSVKGILEVEPKSHEGLSNATRASLGYVRAVD